MMKVYGSRISYYTGKLEMYLRYRSIPYELLPTVGNERKLLDGAGVVQMPVVELDDGRWLTDSTPILAWLDAQQDGAPIYPADPVVRFAALLIEDYADEWLWRPSMHYRWSYRQSREYASSVLADELLSQMWLPRWFKKRLLIRRQLGGFVRGDGVSDATWDHVEGGVLRAFACLESILAQRRFVLGDAPSIADFGLMGPMFRHLAQDPTPSEVMRQRAPGVYAWVARMWNTRASRGAPGFVSQLDQPIADLLVEACETHLVQLRENASAYARGVKRYDQVIQGCQYRSVPTSRYRAWCLEELRREWSELEPAAREELRRYLPQEEASVLWQDSLPKPSDYDPERRAPFNRGINVFGKGVPE